MGFINQFITFGRHHLVPTQSTQLSELFLKLPAKQKLDGVVPETISFTDIFDYQSVNPNEKRSANDGFLYDPHSEKNHLPPKHKQKKHVGMGLIFRRIVVSDCDTILKLKSYILRSYV